jgi:hypothetical protein
MVCAKETQNKVDKFSTKIENPEILCFGNIIFIN